MKSKLLLAIALFCANLLIGQYDNHCITEKLYKKNAVVDLSILKPKDSNFKKDETVYVRTVVHVLYKWQSQNFSNERIDELIQKVNILLRGEDVDTSQINPQHRGILHDTGIQLCLSKIAPDGSPTNGVTRTSMVNDLSDYILNDSIVKEPVKADSLGGKSPWDTGRYLNIWVAPADVNYGVPHFNYFPLGIFLGDRGTPGAVINSSVMYETDPNSTFLPEKILTHEFGHALGLFHTWGVKLSDTNFCESTDFINDTPGTEVVSMVCYDIFEIDSCIDSLDDKFDNQSNMMNYACKLMFTPEQSMAMKNNIANTPELIMSEAECNIFLGVSESIHTYEIDAFPNPSSDFISIEKNIRYRNYTISNIHGQIVAKGFEKTKIDISFLPTGTYFLQVYNEQGYFGSGRIIKI